jgi:hypothetical protein
VRAAHAPFQAQQIARGAHAGQPGPPRGRELVQLPTNQFVLPDPRRAPVYGQQQPNAVLMGEGYGGDQRSYLDPDPATQLEPTQQVPDSQGAEVKTSDDYRRQLSKKKYSPLR